MGLWTLKMVDPLSTQYFLLQFQLGINHFFKNSLTNKKGVSNKKIVTMHSSIMIFAYFICFISLSVLSLRLLEPPLVIVEQSHVFQPIVAAEKDL